MCHLEHINSDAKAIVRTSQPGIVAVLITFSTGLQFARTSPVSWEGVRVGIAAHAGAKHLLQQRHAVRQVRKVALRMQQPQRCALLPQCSAFISALSEELQLKKITAHRDEGLCAVPQVQKAVLQEQQPQRREHTCLNLCRTNAASTCPFSSAGSLL